MPMPAKTAASYSATAQKAAAAVRKEKKELKLTPKQRIAIEAMVFEGQERRQAAKTANLSDEAIRVALTKPHVLAYLNECQEVLRTSLRPRALHKMGKLLNAKTERIQFESAKYLDGMDRPSHTIGAQQINVNVQNNVNVETPGYVIKLNRKHSEQIDHLVHDIDNQLISNEVVPDED